MSVQAAVTQYRQEIVLTFEKRVSLLRDCVTTQAIQNGNSVVFPVGGQAARPVTRGPNGRIPGASPNTVQVPIPLEEWHHVPEITDFDSFASQADQRALMNIDAMQAINWKIDDQIIGALNTGTVNTGAATTADADLVGQAKVILGNGKVPWDGEIYGLITAAFDEYLERITSYASQDFVNTKPMENPNAFADKVKMRVWKGVKWIVHPELPGAGTNAEKCFLFHKRAIGHAIDTRGLRIGIGYDERDDFYYARHSLNANSALLQNSGVVVMNHDGSGFAAA